MDPSDAVCGLGRAASSVVMSSVSSAPSNSKGSHAHSVQCRLDRAGRSRAQRRCSATIDVNRDKGEVALRTTPLRVVGSLATLLITEERTHRWIDGHQHVLPRPKAASPAAKHGLSYPTKSTNRQTPQLTPDGGRIRDPEPAEDLCKHATSKQLKISPCFPTKQPQDTRLQQCVPHRKDRSPASENRPQHLWELQEVNAPGDQRSAAISSNVATTEGELGTVTRERLAWATGLVSLLDQLGGPPGLASFLANQL